MGGDDPRVQFGPCTVFAHAVGLSCLAATPSDCLNEALGSPLNPEPSLTYPVFAFACLRRLDS